MTYNVAIVTRGQWSVVYYIWYSEEGPGHAVAHPVPSSLYQMSQPNS